MNGSTSVPRWRVRATVDVLKQSLDFRFVSPWLVLHIAQRPSEAVNGISFDFRNRS